MIDVINLALPFFGLISSATHAAASSGCRKSG
jgi:hypothetical protein